MSSHDADARKVESIMIKLNIDKTNKNLAIIASQDLNLSLDYVKKIIASNVETLDRAKLNPYHASNHQKFINERSKK